MTVAYLAWIASSSSRSSEPPCRTPTESDWSGTKGILGDLCLQAGPPGHSGSNCL